MSLPTADAHAPPKASKVNPWATLVAISFGVMMVAVDGTIVAVANPAIGADLGTTLAELQWVTHGYLLGLAVFLITSGKFGDRFGHRRVYFIGVIGFGATSLAIGLSQGIPALIGLRILQGAFGSAIIPSALGLLRLSFPKEKLNRAIGVFSGLIGASTAAGPIAGGVLVSAVSWQAVFFVNVPIAVIAVVLGLRLLPANHAVDPDSRFDVVGILLLSVAMFGVVFALVSAPEEGWTHPVTLGSAATGLVIACAFVWWQSRVREPLLPLSIFRSASLSIGTVLTLLMALAMFGSMFFLTFYFQGVQGLTALETGLRVMPLSVMLAFGPPVAGRIIERFGIRLPAALGLLATAVALFGMSLVDGDTGPVTTGSLFLLLGGGLGVVMVAATDAIVGNAPMRLSGVAGGMQQAAMQLGGSLGTAVLGALLGGRVAASLPDRFVEAGLPAPGAGEIEGMRSQVSQAVPVIPDGASAEVAAATASASHAAFLDGMGFAFTVGAAVALVAAGLALFLSRGEAESGPVVHV
ncbi:EmrB/QacA subfamily drug resistance transporter [Actinoalloteichus hoggarensis]|uniref:Multidrug resistance protein stp n=1 Tax=Actinoalloteichus hoggarensis TaxID=1470176 RepID=A0A221W7T2_9PSEU|nr:MFS transporter [Actinoalloteichus hoggarensis]ASO21814.1 Multidrug resistance protein stp [Actinoalloteichus hoggarensis]MBB5922412.1 EmrB/QacA subfamily drug resistance transporter [Actinoalloteichus hoggarensis]